MNIDCCKSYVGKQIIGLAPGGEPALCLYSTGQQVDSNCTGFNSAFGDWTWGGFVNDPNGYANSVGAYYVVDGYGSCFPFYTDIESSIQFYYIGTTPPPNFVVNSPGGDYDVAWNLNLACSFGCIQTPSTRYFNSPYGWINIPTLLIFDCNPILYGVPLDWSNPVDVQNTLNGVIGTYQTGASCQVIDDGGGFYTIRFNDVYYNPAYLTNGISLWYDLTGSPTAENISLSPC